MSTLEKFKNHKTAYLLKMTGHVPEYQNISEIDIVSVGRKYVTIANDVKQDALDYVEKGKLQRGLQNQKVFLVMYRLKVSDVLRVSSRAI